MRIPFALTAVLALLLVICGCGGSEPDPGTILDRALTRENLSGFGNGPEGPTAGIVAVQALGFEDRVLQEQEVKAPPSVMTDIREGLGGDNGLRALVQGLKFDGTESVDGAETNHISGDLEASGLARALKDAGGGGVGSLAGVEEADLEKALAFARFDLYAGKDDGVIRRVDLILALDDPHNALPPTRIRFSLTPVDPGATTQ